MDVIKSDKLLGNKTRLKLYLLCFLVSFLAVVILVFFAYLPLETRVKFSESLPIIFLGLVCLGVGFLTVKTKTYGGLVGSFNPGGIFIQFVSSKIFGWKNITPVFIGKTAVRIGWFFITAGTPILIIGFLITYFRPVFMPSQVNIGDIIYRNPVLASLPYRIVVMLAVGLFLVTILYLVYRLFNISKAPIKWLAFVVKSFCMFVVLLFFYLFGGYAKCQINDMFSGKQIISGTILNINYYQPKSAQNSATGNSCSIYRLVDTDELILTTRENNHLSFFTRAYISRVLQNGWKVEVSYLPHTLIIQSVKILQK